MNIIKKVSYEAPSNIALVKYWGKHGIQMPSNPSMSFTLSECKSTFEVTLLEKKSQKDDIVLLFEKSENYVFVHKIKSLFEKIEKDYPIVHEYDWLIESSNTFPHSSGIASSASSMAALAMCVESLQHDHVDLKRASNIARLGSGSAARSVIPKLAWWGESDVLKESSDDFAIQISNDVDPVFHKFHDSILIISSDEKAVSSSVGHDLMNHHPYKNTRYKNAKENIAKLYDAMKVGDIHTFGEIVEYEAMSLHALMMMSHPSYILIKPNTLAAIEKLKNYREDSLLPIYYTLDAGPNLHILYPDDVSKQVQEWIKSELYPLCEGEKAIYDKVGDGPKKLA